MPSPASCRAELLVLLRQLRLEAADDTEDGLGEEERAEQNDASQESWPGQPWKRAGEMTCRASAERRQEEQRRQDGEQLEATQRHRC